MKVKAYIEYKLHIASRQLEGDCDERLTAKLRGKISAYRDLLGAENPLPAISDTDA